MKNAKPVGVVVAILVVLFCLPSCGGSRTTTDVSSSASSQDVTVVSHPQQEPSYSDSRWPTNDSQLLAIPENDRWYHSREKVGTTCTLTGPVVEVYQAKDEAGMPIFVDVGAAYPSSEGFTLLIWADSLSDFEEMLYAVDDGDGWLSVTGYLSMYNNRPQFDISDGRVELTWWPH